MTSGIKLKTTTGTIDADRLLDEMVSGAATLVTAKLAPLLARIEALEEAQTKSLHFRGTHQKCDEYARGALVLHGGQPWVAIKSAPPGEVPGRSDFWQLLMKAER